MRLLSRIKTSNGPRVRGIRPVKPSLFLLSILILSCQGVLKVGRRTELIAAMVAVKPNALPACNTVLCGGFCVYWQLCV